MKNGQLVVLVKRNIHPLHDIISGSNKFPPIGASGEVVSQCGVTGGDGPGVHVEFPNHPCAHEGTWWHVPKAWLLPINDPDAKIASKDQQELDLGNGEKLTEKDLVKMGRKMLQDTPA